MRPRNPSRRVFNARLVYIATVAAACVSAGLPQPGVAQPTASEQKHQRAVNPVVHWNSVADEALTPSQGTNPMAHSRIFAILHASIHDALNAIDRRYESYTPGLPTAKNANADAAVAAASREVLVRLLPERAALVETAYGHALAGLRDGASKTAGIGIGQAAAWATLNRRQNDGAAGAAIPYVPGSAPGEYQFTPPFDFAAQPVWGRVRPFVIAVEDHELEGPQVLTSNAYARDFAFIKDIGHIASAARTAEQTEVAKFWYEDSTLGWNGVTRQFRGFSRAAEEDGLSRLYAGIHFRHAVRDGRRQGRGIGQAVADALPRVR